MARFKNYITERGKTLIQTLSLGHLSTFNYHLSFFGIASLLLSMSLLIHDFFNICYYYYFYCCIIYRSIEWKSAFKDKMPLEKFFFFWPCNEKIKNHYIVTGRFKIPIFFIVLPLIYNSGYSKPLLFSTETVIAHPWRIKDQNKYYVQFYRVIALVKHHFSHTRG